MVNNYEPKFLCTQNLNIIEGLETSSPEEPTKRVNEKN